MKVGESWEFVRQWSPESFTVKVQPQSAVQEPWWAADRVSAWARPMGAAQASANSSAGDSQQQTHGLVPQFLPSHCQAARACEPTACNRSARRVTSRNVRERLTVLIMAQVAGTRKVRMRHA
jgi:hypothetical protein